MLGGFVYMCVRGASTSFCLLRIVSPRIQAIIWAVVEAQLKLCRLIASCRTLPDLKSCPTDNALPEGCGACASALVLSEGPLTKGYGQGHLQSRRVSARKQREWVGTACAKDKRGQGQHLLYSSRRCSPAATAGKYPNDTVSQAFNDAPDAGGTAGQDRLTAVCYAVADAADDVPHVGVSKAPPFASRLQAHCSDFCSGRLDIVIRKATTSIRREISQIQSIQIGMPRAQQTLSRSTTLSCLAHSSPSCGKCRTNSSRQLLTKPRAQRHRRAAWTFSKASTLPGSGLCCP